MSRTKSIISTTVILAAVLAAPATHAGGFLTEFLFNAGGSAVRGLFGAAKDGIVNAVKTKESPEEKAAREREEIAKAVEQTVAQYPEDQREAIRSRLNERLTLVYQQYSALEARQAAAREERNSIVGIFGNAVLDGAGTTIGNRAALSAAGVAATHRVGATSSSAVMDVAATQAQAGTVGQPTAGGFDFAKMRAIAVGTAGAHSIRPQGAQSETIEQPITVATPPASDATPLPAVQVDRPTSEEPVAALPGQPAPIIVER